MLAQVVFMEKVKANILKNELASTPIQLYAATKRSNELMAYAYSSLYKIKTIGLRFFTVYGPWGRPDMSLFLFTKKIINNQHIKVFNRGNHYRDFTYIDDIVKGIYLCAKKCIKSSKKKLIEIFNIAGGKTVKLSKFISTLEKKLGKKQKKNIQIFKKATLLEHVDRSKKLKNLLVTHLKISVKKGISNFVDWYKSYYLS